MGEGEISHEKITFLSLMLTWCFCHFFPNPKNTLRTLRFLCALCVKKQPRTAAPHPSLRGPEARHGPSVTGDGLEEHLRRAHPESAIAVERLVHDHRLARLGVLRVADKPVSPALEMDELPPDQRGVILSGAHPRRVCGNGRDFSSRHKVSAIYVALSILPIRVSLWQLLS